MIHSPIPHSFYKRLNFFPPSSNLPFWLVGHEISSLLPNSRIQNATHAGHDLVTLVGITQHGWVVLIYTRFTWVCVHHKVFLT